MSTSNNGIAGSLKRMRKGTRSCVECRRRKRRCIWPLEAEKCGPCVVRGNRCLEQTYIDSRSSHHKKPTMRERINELEELLSQILNQHRKMGLSSTLDRLELSAADVLKKLRLDSGSYPVDTESTSSDLLGTSPSLTPISSAGWADGLEKAPLSGLFDNAILHRETCDILQNVPFKSSRGSLGITERNRKLLRSLRSLALDAQALDLIIRESRTSLCLLDKTFPHFPGLGSYCLDNSEFILLREHIISTFESDNVANVLKVLLSLASCIQQLPASFKLSYGTTPAPLETLHVCYMESAEAFLTPDEGIACTIDGLECMMAQVRYYLNFGLPRKSWLIIRRAVTFLQVLSKTNDAISGGQMDNRERILWFHMWQADRSLSLILGLPYAFSSFPYRIQSAYGPGSILPTKAQFMFKLATVAGHVIDRNQQQDDSQYTATLNIDLQLEECRNIMPSAWWEASADSETPIEAIYERYTVKLWFYNLKNHIHLPFLLKSLADPGDYLGAHEALAASRAMIECYQVLRDEHRPILRVCNIVDFQVFTAAMIIVLCLLRGFRGYDYQQREEDWEVIRNLINILNRVSGDVLDGVPTQAAHFLESLCRFRHSSSDTNETFQATVPYFGRIRIRKVRGSPPTLNPTGSIQMSTALHPSLGDDPGADHYVDFESYIQNDYANLWTVVPDWARAVDLGFQDGWNWDLN
ncbi:hypothetical protein OIDMADRAFT_148112 [Oidiodendron maius Zn]|uniref:Zn(2)-C6 fungal-type domain-containing protein n=1 Tax=Oidiodendron maius (strain Zn) TaxID=913774 RepID=A0A0C3CDC4_OIDMZ|nr:hypothetical protein OIDMADRAFT_148112 [Oidiodendron maius Zn]